MLFQSTSLSRGKTEWACIKTTFCDLSIHFPLTREDSPHWKWELLSGSFNPLPSHEGRLFLIPIILSLYSFNPLPSHEGRRITMRCILLTAVFQSTSLSRGKTNTMILMTNEPDLSIHFPLTREDSQVRLPPYKSGSFNPLPSHEGRLQCLHFRVLVHLIFQSTSLSRGKTATLAGILLSGILSIHFPLTREDHGDGIGVLICCLSIHFPLTREDPHGVNNVTQEIDFQSTSLSRGKTCTSQIETWVNPFNPLPSHEGRQNNLINRLWI